MNTYLVTGEKRDAAGQLFGSDAEPIRADSAELAGEIFLSRHGNGTSTTWAVTQVEQKD